MDELIVDTSIIIEYLKKGEGLLTQIWDHYKLIVPVTVITELLIGLEEKQADIQTKLTDLISTRLQLADLDEKIARKAADIVKELDHITLASALVAATAIVKEVPLLTYEIQTFDLVPDLKLVDL